MMRFQREVTCVVEVYFGVRVVALERFSPWRQKERVALTPDREQWRPFCTEVLLELRGERADAGLGEGQIELYLIVAGLGQQRGVKPIRFRRHQRLVL